MCSVKFDQEAYRDSKGFLSPNAQSKPPQDQKFSFRCEPKKTIKRVTRNNANQMQFASKSTMNFKILRLYHGATYPSGNHEGGFNIPPIKIRRHDKERSSSYLGDLLEVPTNSNSIKHSRDSLEEPPPPSSVSIVVLIAIT